MALNMRAQSGASVPGGNEHAASAMPRLAALRITVAPNGARRGKADHPGLPITAEEISAEAARCLQAGASEIHLHVRDSAGNHSLDPARYAEAIDAIRATAPGMKIQITTEAAGQYAPAEQLRAIRSVVPEAASVAVREVSQAPEIAEKLYGFAAEAGIEIQHILYDANDLALLRRLLRAGIVPAAMRSVLLVMGRYAPPVDARPLDLAPFVAALGHDFPDWAVCAFGRDEHRIACAAAAMGGHVRVGFENNLLRPDGTTAASNAENVAAIADAARAIGRPLVKVRGEP